MKKDFRTSLLLKLISFILSAFVWALVINSIRPVVNDYINIPINTINEASIKKLDKTYIVKSPLICKVSYKIDEERQSVIRQNDFKAYIDLNDLLTTNDLPIHYEIQNGVDKYISNIRIEPRTVHVVLDDAVRTEFPVTYDFVGKLNEGHSVGNVIISPNTILVSGGDEILQNIAHISISIPISEQDDNFTGVEKIHVIGKNGREIQNVGAEFSTNEVNYSVSIFTRANVSLNVKTNGNLPEGYKVKNSMVTPNAIMVEGPRSIISDLYSINLPPIDLTGAMEDIERIVPLNDALPQGTRCQTVEAVRVKVEIEKVVNEENNIVSEPTSTSKVIIAKKDSEAERND